MGILFEIISNIFLPFVLGCLCLLLFLICIFGIIQVFCLFIDFISQLKKNK